jgi:transposase-like protein
MNTVLAQDTEVVSKAKRRTFTAEQKREFLRQAAACKEPGELGALLRREGLYSSHLSSWRREMEERGLAGLAPKKRGPKVTPPSPEEVELRRLRREVAVLTARAKRAEALVAIQKKVASLLGLELPKPSDES